jgi:hypothetical protein
VSAAADDRKRAHPVAAFVERTAQASGVPQRVEDPAVAEQVADLLRSDESNDAGPKPDVAATIPSPASSRSRHG